MKIDKSSASDILNSENASIDNAIISCMDQIQGMQAAIPCGQISSPLMLTGRAFQALADRTQNLRLPAAKGHLIALDAIREANKANSAAIALLPETSPGILDTDACASLISDLQAQNNNLRDQEQYYSSLTPGDASWMYVCTLPYIRSMIYGNDTMIQELQDKIQAAEDYAQRSSSFYSDAAGKASEILKKSTRAINGFLVNGSYGDTSWRRDIDIAYQTTCAKLRERVFLELSNTGDGVAIISDDFQYIYYKGVKWEIDKYVDPDFSDTPANLSRPFEDIDTVYLEGDLLMNWGQLLAGLSLSDSGETISGKGSGVARGANATLDLGEDTLEALDKSWVKLVFSSNGTDNKVIILGGSTKQTDADREYLGFKKESGVLYYPPKKVEKEISDSWDYADSIYNNITGGHLNSDVNYKFYYIPDDNRKNIAEHNNYYDVLFFDKDGKLKSVSLMWPGDKYEIRGSDGSVFECGYKPQTPVEASSDYVSILEPIMDGMELH